jgi:hypothetical protein
MLMSVHSLDFDTVDIRFMAYSERGVVALRRYIRGAKINAP